MDEKLMQRKYVQMQLLKNQLNGLIDEKKMINERVEELMVTLNALQNLEYMKSGNEIWSTLGSSVFVMSDVKDTENVLVGVGAGVVIKDTRENAIKIVESKLNEINRFDQEIVAEINKHTEQINRVEMELYKMQEEERNQVK